MRPPLLAVLAWVVAQARWRERVSIYAVALVLATVGELLTILLLGGPALATMAAVARGFGVALPMLGLADLLVQAARRLGGRGLVIVAALLLMLAGSLPVVREAAMALAMSGGLPGRAAAGPAPTERLAILTALPIIWGEGDVADVLAGRAMPADIHRELQRHYGVMPIDRADEAALAGQRLLLIAQPRALDPEELVAIDGWVRGGGRVLILADPALVWPSRWPVADPRRPPVVTLLDPLLTHWGLTLAAPVDPVARMVRMLGGRRLETQGAGAFARRSGPCRISEAGLVADCRLGRGRALLVADADLLDGRQWLGPGRFGADRQQRRADNVGLVLAWLSSLSGTSESPSRGAVAWIDPAKVMVLPVTIGLLPALLAIGGALMLGRGRLGTVGDVVPGRPDHHPSLENNQGTKIPSNVENALIGLQDSP